MDIRKALPRPIRRILWTIISFFSMIRWKIMGKPNPPPHIIKVNTIRNYARLYKINFLVETGTYWGDTIDAVIGDFRRIYSIELDEYLFKRAISQFKGYKQVKILNGDSSKILVSLLKKMKGPALFWLDAHYSGEGTARGEKYTPIEREVELILNSKVGKKSIILIDDARLFTGNNDYPEITSFKKYIHKNYIGKEIQVKNDIILINSSRNISMLSSTKNLQNA